MILRVANNRHAAAVFSDRIPLRNGVQRIIRTLCLDVGTNLANQGTYIELGENDDRVHVCECCNNFCTLFRGHHGTPVTFQCPHRLIGIYGHHEFAAKFFRSPQVADMSHVQQIEIAVGQNDALAGVPPLLHALADFGSSQNFLPSHFYLCLIQNQ